jgi:ribonuclease HI
MADVTLTLDLVQRLWASVEAHEVSIIWIKGHSGDPDNESVDTLCTAKITEKRACNAEAVNGGLVAK